MRHRTSLRMTLSISAWNLRPDQPWPPGKAHAASDSRMTAPLRVGENAVAGTSRDMSGEIMFPSHHIVRVEQVGNVSYLAECPTLNFAFIRLVYDAIGGFDGALPTGPMLTSRGA